MPIPKQLIVTGQVYIKYIDEISSPKIGDILLHLNDDATSTAPWNYENMNVSGYIKARIFDGKAWQNIDISEFCTNKENKFTKKQRAIDSAYLCRDIINQRAGCLLFKTYRGHFTMEEYEQGEFIRRKNSDRRKKT